MGCCGSKNPKYVGVTDAEYLDDSFSEFLSSSDLDSYDDFDAQGQNDPDPKAGKRD